MIPENLLGWLTFFIILLFTLNLTKKHPDTSKFLLFAFSIRSFFVIIDQYFINLPDSTGDAFMFENRAFKYSQEFGLNIFKIIIQDDSYFISRFISIFYTLLDRSPMMAKMISVGFGTAAVFLIYSLTLTLWDSRAAIKAGWFASLFPSLILYSSLILREIYVIFFLTYALIYSVKFIKKNRFIYFIKTTVGFLSASFFHGPIIIGCFIFFVYVFYKIFKRNNFFIRFKKRNAIQIILLPILLLPFITYFLGYYSIPKIGYINNIGSYKNSNIKADFEKIIIWKIKNSTRSSANKVNGASYPSWTIPKDFSQIVYLTPIRMIYFLYSPFPWDIKQIKHLVGLLDSFFYIYLSICIFINRKYLLKNSQTNFLIILLLIYIFIYSFGIGNFGTGIRHRLKIIGILIAIAAPKIKKIKIL